VKGIVKVNNISVRNLPKMDIVGKTDPYVVMRLGDEEKQTSVAHETLNYDYKNEEY
jgi:Ca2+-dependent lipid-binding protein